MVTMRKVLALLAALLAAPAFAETTFPPGSSTLAIPTSTLPLRFTPVQSPIPTDGAVQVWGTTTSTRQNFLASFELKSDSISNPLGGAVALQANVECTPNSGGCWSSALTTLLDAGFPVATYPAFGIETGISNLSGSHCGDFGSGCVGSIGASYNGLGYRNTGAVYINNMQQSFTAGSSAGAQPVVQVPLGVPAWIVAGAVFQDITHPSYVPAGAKVVSTTATTITLDQNITTTIPAGDAFILSQPLWYWGMKIAPYAVSQYGIWDASNSDTSIRITGTHSYGIDLSGGTYGGYGLRLGLGAGAGVGVFNGTSNFSAFYADGSGNLFVSSPTGNLFLGINANVSGAFTAVTGAFTALPTSGTAVASVCIDASGNLFKKTTSGACL